MPRETDGLGIMGGNVLLIKLFQQFLGHPIRRRVVQQISFRQVIAAVRAVEVAPRTNRLDDDVEGARIIFGIGHTLMLKPMVAAQSLLCPLLAAFRGIAKQLVSRSAEDLNRKIH
jgi:hypothetical protein